MFRTYMSLLVLLLVFPFASSGEDIPIKYCGNRLTRKYLEVCNFCSQPPEGMVPVDWEKHFGNNKTNNDGTNTHTSRKRRNVCCEEGCTNEMLKRACCDQESRKRLDELQFKDALRKLEAEKALISTTPKHLAVPHHVSRNPDHENGESSTPSEHIAHAHHVPRNPDHGNNQYNTNGDVYLTAVDFPPSIDINASLYTCLKENGYSTVFLEAYKSIIDGKVNKNAPDAITYAQDANLGVELYMAPDGSSETRSGDQQVDDMLEYLNKSSVTVKRIWLRVRWTDQWTFSTSENIDFINKAIRRLWHYNIHVGIFTNEEDWTKLTGNVHLNDSDTIWLWYANSPTSTMDFSDFKPFAGFDRPVVKQYKVDQYVCGFYPRGNVYVDIQAPERFFPRT